VNKVKDFLYEWILEEPSLKYRQKLQYFGGGVWEAGIVSWDPDTIESIKHCYERGF